MPCSAGRGLSDPGGTGLSWGCWKCCQGCVISCHQPVPGRPLSSSCRAETVDGAEPPAVCGGEHGRGVNAAVTPLPTARASRFCFLICELSVSGLKVIMFVWILCQNLQPCL